MTPLDTALDGLGVEVVRLAGGPVELLLAVTRWAAARGDVRVTRGAAAAGPGRLLVTGDAADAAAAVAAGGAVLYSGTAEVTWPDALPVQRVADAATLVAAATPRTPSAPPAPSALPDLAIVIPVHGAAEELRRCLLALSRNTTVPARLIVIDDASPGLEVAALLEDLDGWPHVTVLRNSSNLGFTATVNRGLRACTGDVVVLNSDTEVGPRWLERLRAAAATDPRIGTVTAVSDNAGAFAVPVIGEANPTPAHLDRDSAARLVAQATGGRLADTPTANGFCMYVRRTMLDDVGLLDEAAFPRGYGEENDLSMRAGARGWRHVVDTGTFVHHVREASFGAEKAALAKAGRAVIDERHPGYTAAVRAFVADPGMAAAREDIAAAFAGGRSPLPRILYVIHEGGGGTPVGNFELMRGLAGRAECLLFTCDRTTLRLDRMEDGERVPLKTWTLDSTTRVLDFTRADYRGAVEEVLREHAIDLVHVRHLFKHTFDAPVVAARLGIPVVFSFHDFYFSCPTVNLLDDQDVYCGGVCTPGDGACRVPPAGLDGLPHLKHAFVHQWREEVGAMLSGVDAFITTSPHVRDVHRQTLPIADRPFHVIPHGRTLRQQHGLHVAPTPGGPVRILFIGNLEVHKGAEYLRRLRELDASGRIELHFLGDVPPRYADLGVVHGRFAPEELSVRVRDIGPAMVGIFSICAETFSHSLTEAWAMGIPAVTTDLGALAERIGEHAGGWLVPVDDPAEAVRRILAVADDPEEYRRQVMRADLRGVAGPAEMTDAYAAVYAEVLDARRALAPAAGAPAVLARGTRRLTAVVSGADGIHPGSTYVRVVQRFRHPAVARRLPARLRNASDGVLPDDAELVLVQRTALPPEHVPPFLEEIAARELPLVVDLDDHLLLAEEEGYADHRDPLLALLAAADLVLASTPRLEQEIAPYCRTVAVVPNMLDEALFLDGGVSGPPRAAEDDDVVRLAYVGSPTHGADLALLEPVMAELQRRAPGRYVLEVIGVQPAAADAAWFTRLPVPDDDKPYPHFVRWLRRQRPRWQVGLAPLTDTPFNACKSDLKWLEYTALGLPVVASDREPYATITDGITGRRLPDDPVAWADAIERLTSGDGSAERQVDAAWEEVVGTRLLRHHAEDLLELLLRLRARP